MLLFTQHYSARCFGMNMPKSRGLIAKVRNRYEEDTKILFKNLEKRLQKIFFECYDKRNCKSNEKEK